MENPTVATIQEKVQAYLTKTAPPIVVRDYLTAYREQFHPKPEKSFWEKITDVISGLVYIQKNYEYALELMRTFFNHTKQYNFITELYFLQSKCHLALNDFESAMRSINLCISYNGRESVKNTERTMLIQELKAIAYEGYNQQHPTKQNKDFNYCES